MQSVLDILEEVESARATPNQVVARSFDAVAGTDTAIGAFACMANRDETLEAAAKATGPLAGLAIGIKDIFDTYDLPTELGTPIHAGRRPDADAASVALMRARGASIIGKTVTTEMAFLNPAATRNPHDLNHTPGGSSSGSAAAVAAGMVPVATGTQTGGSVIRPAAYCGVAGYKPSFRLVPTVGVKTFSWSLDTLGFFAATLPDVAEFTARLTGRALAAERMEAASLRVGLYRSAIDGQADAEMKAALAHAAHLLEKAGAAVIEIDEPAQLADARDIHGTIQNYEAALALGFEWAHHRGRMSEVLFKTLEQGRAITPAAYDDARRTARRARHETTALFERVDALLMPSATGAAPAGLGSTGSPIFNKLWTLTGNPCVNVAGLSNAAGLPLGLQMVTRFGRDRLALSAGALLETLLADRRIAATVK